MYFSIGESGRRNRWTIKLNAQRLLENCTERINYHQSRADWWGSERTIAEGRLRSEGIQLKHFETSGGQRTEAHLDPSLAGRVSECQSKEKFHNDAVNRFVAFKAFFSLAGDEFLELNTDDVLYFNIGDADTGKEEEGVEND